MSYTPNVVLDTVTSNQTSPVTVLGSFHSKLSLQVVIGGSGSPTGTVSLQGSLDGVNFDVANALATFTIGTDTSGAIKYSIDKPVFAYRVVLASLAGGTKPTITATVGVDALG